MARAYRSRCRQPDEPRFALWVVKSSWSGCQPSFGQTARQMEGTPNARLELLGDGLPPGLGTGVKAWVAEGSAAEQFSTEDQTRPPKPLPERVRALRRGRARHHGERAPQHLDLSDHFGSSNERTRSLLI